MPRAPVAEKRKTKPAYAVLIKKAHSVLIHKHRGGYTTSSIYHYLVKHYNVVSLLAIKTALRRLEKDGKASHDGAHWKLTKSGLRVATKKKRKTNRTLSPYMKFSASQRAKIVAANPGATFGEIGKLLGAAWKKLSAAEQAEYGKSAAKKAAAPKKARKAAPAKEGKKKAAGKKSPAKAKSAKKPAKKTAKKATKKAEGEKPKKKRSASPKRKKSAEKVDEVGAEIAPEVPEEPAEGRQKAPKAAKGRGAAAAKGGRGGADAAPRKVARKKTAPLDDDSNPNPADPRAQKAKPSYENLEGVEYKWQYQDNGWRDYSPKASAVVENHWKAYTADPHKFDVGAVQSGDWEYRVDFKAMNQTNVVHHAHTSRAIRRVIKD